MQKILTPAQMGAADRAAIDSGVPSRELMTRAGRALGRKALAMVGGGYGKRAVLVCGKGNNGGDGFVCAAHLAHHGVLCTAVTMADPADLTGDAAWAFTLLEPTACRVRRFDPSKLPTVLGEADLVVDALLGTGFKGTLRGPIAEAVELINSCGVDVLAVDIPSGVDGRTGQIAGPAIRARATVTMGALKAGLVLLPGAEVAGEVQVADIGIPDEVMEATAHLAGEADLAGRLYPRRPSAHKRSVGKVVIAAGSVGMTGAATLAATGAMRAGAGLVKVAVPASIRAQVAPTIVEVLTVGVDETNAGTFAPSAASQVAEWASEWDALALGPGIGRGPEVSEFVEAVLQQATVPVVLDADGLAVFAGRAEWLEKRSAPTILTPHAGELGTLLSMSPAEVESSRLDTARRAAQITGATVLLKGFRTVVAEPSGGTVLVDAGGPMLATAGTGDVLTGMIAAFAARSHPVERQMEETRMIGALTQLTHPFEAAWSAACLHGLAGEHLAARIGSESVIARDLAGAIGEVMRRLER